MSTTGQGNAEQIQALLDTVEDIRASRFPEVPAELVRRILLHHADPAASERNVSMILRHP